MITKVLTQKINKDKHLYDNLRQMNQQINFFNNQFFL
jgi:hypothetical protein